MKATGKKAVAPVHCGGKPGILAGLPYLRIRAVFGVRAMADDSSFSILHAAHMATDGPRRWMIAAQAGTVHPAAFHHWRTAAEWIATHEDREIANAAVRLLLHVMDAAGIEIFTIQEPDERDDTERLAIRMRALLCMARRVRAWVRPVEAWTLSIGEDERHSLFQLARHLLVKWDIPSFMDTAWLVKWDGGLEAWVDWYQQIGAGGTVRGGAACLAMSAGQARYFADIPDTYMAGQHESFMLAYLDMRLLGADSERAHELAVTQLGRPYVLNGMHRPFWLSVARFFLAHPEIPSEQLDPLCDYLRAIRFGGGAEAQPGIVMTGRSPEKLLGQMRRWHRGAGREAWRAQQVFAPSGFCGTQDVREGDLPEALRGWRLSEVLTRRGLIEESRVLRHCVQTYDGRCAAGLCSIWSVRRVGSDGRARRRLTIEVEKGGRIIQVRGRDNRWPTKEERHVVAAWATWAGVKLMPFAVGEKSLEGRTG